MSNPREATQDLARAVADVFKKHSLSVRRQAWNRFTSEEGHKEIQKLIINPKRTLNRFRTLNFREWIDNS